MKEYVRDTIISVVLIAIVSALFASVLVYALSGICDCITLEVSGHSIGSGLHQIVASGENLSIQSAWNNSTWNLTATSG